jgi:integrase
MSLTKRGKYWRIHFFTPSGEEIRISSGTEDRQQAQEYEDDLKRRAWRDSKLGDKLTKTWEDAALRWFEEKFEKKSIEDDRSRAKWLTTHLAGMFLSDITVELVNKLAKLKLAESSPATANRHLQLLRSILRMCVNQWGYLDKAPKVTLFKEAERRIRWLTPEQAKTLLAELPFHTRAAAILALCIGQRESNIVGLMWQQVNMKKRTITLFGDQTKNGEPLGIPLNDSAMAVLESLKGLHPEYVITYKGKPVKRVGTRAWNKAKKRAGIKDFRWHDLRHTWASWHVQNGTPLYNLQEMGNWKDPKMVRKYAHLAVEHLQKHADNLPAI